MDKIEEKEEHKNKNEEHNITYECGNDLGAVSKPLEPNCSVWFQVCPLRNGANLLVGCQRKADTGSRHHCHCRNSLTVHAFVCRKY